MLLSGLFELLAVAQDFVRGEHPSETGCYAAREMCRAQANRLRQTLDALPVALGDHSSS